MASLCVRRRFSLTTRVDSKPCACLRHASTASFGGAVGLRLTQRWVWRATSAGMREI